MNRKRAIITVILLIGVGVLFLYPMDVYISKPGGAYDLTPLVEVEGGDENDKGTFSLMTIALAKATPASYAYSTFSSQRKFYLHTKSVGQVKMRLNTICAKKD